MSRDDLGVMALGVAAVGTIALIMSYSSERKEPYITQLCPPSVEQTPLPAQDLSQLEATLSNEQEIPLFHKGPERDNTFFSQRITRQYDLGLEYEARITGEQAIARVIDPNLDSRPVLRNDELYRQDNGCWEGEQ